MEYILFGFGVSILFSVFGQIIAWCVVDSIISERQRRIYKIVRVVSLIVGVVLVVAANLL